MFRFFLALLLAFAKKVDVTHSVFDSSIADVQWMKPDSSVSLITTARGQIWRSSNRGKTFTPISADLNISGTSPLFDYVLVHPLDKLLAMAISRNRTHFITSDAGLTWRPFGPASVYNVVFHPLRPNYILFSQWSDACRSSAMHADDKKQAACYHMLFVTTDFGATYQKIKDYVVQYSWGDGKNSPDDIFLTYHSRTSGHQNRFGGWHPGVDFAVSRDLGRSVKTIIEGGNKFLVSGEYIFVAQVDDPQFQTVRLMVSSNKGLDFARAKIPTTLTDKSYTILDTSEGLVVIHVNHGTGSEGNVYISDSSGINYSLSLPNNVRTMTGECEFDRILGMDGVYLANFRDEETQSQPPRLIADNVGVGASVGSVPQRPQFGHIRTVVSFDKGGSWNYLKPPRLDSLGKPITCENTANCFLHLHGITHFDRYAPFYSVENAWGIIMGTGNVGSHLLRDDSNVNTFISRDGGLSWQEAHKGAFIYEYGDSGGLIVMANDLNATDQVVFTWNEGHSWYDFDLGKRNINVDNIIIEPSSAGLEFLMYGTLPSNEQGVAFHLDFSTLGQVPCIGHNNPNSVSSDYETWNPSDRCTLGRKVTYVRKRVTSECFNGPAFKPVLEKSPCECAMEDFLCETGFYRPPGSIECLPSPYEDREYMKVEGCTSSGIYYTNAYRKIPGDLCTGGFSPAQSAVPCPPSSPYPHQAKASLLIIVVALSFILFIAWASRHPLLRRYVIHSGFDTFVEVSYQVVGKATDTVHHKGEELFNYWTNSVVPTTENPGHETGINMSLDNSLFYPENTPNDEKTLDIFEGTSSKWV